MIPQEELDRFVLTFSEAIANGGEGRAVRGYLLLKDGLRAAQESSHADAEEVRRLWSAGLESFQQQFPATWYPE